MYSLQPTQAHCECYERGILHLSVPHGLRLAYLRYCIVTYWYPSNGMVYYDRQRLAVIEHGARSNISRS